MSRVVLLIALCVASAFVGHVGARGDGSRAAELKALREENDSLRRTRARVDTIYAAEKLVYAGWRERWDTTRVRHLERVLDSLRRLGVARPETTVIEVPVSVLVTADSTIRACEALVLTCEQRVEIRDRENANLRRQNQLLERGTSRARSAAGLSYDPRTGALGAWAERDLWRLRGGVSVTPARDGLRAELRAGWRW
ncbi:MAG: hypothetical protein C0503_02835 [Gemmatimonas sp.]|nr:hypothetical protein [Gemmatimonas sp.]